MMDDVLNPSRSNTQRGYIGEILEHAEFLLNTPMTNQQQDRISAIQNAAQNLAAQWNNRPKADFFEQEIEGHENSQPSSRVEQPALPSLNILLAEDNPFTQKLMSRLLIQNNHQVEMVSNGQEVLEKWQGGRFDLILLDIRMPVLDGISAAESIRAKEMELGRKITPIIAITSLSGKADKNRILKSGINGFHAKPIRATVLNQEIGRVLQLNTNETVMSQTIDKQKQSRSTSGTDSSSAEKPIQLGIDMDKLLKTVDNDWGLIREITNLFFSDVPNQLERIQKALESQDANELLEAAHSLKGAAGAFGENMVYSLSYELEKLGRSNELDRAESCISKLKKALIDMERTLQKTLAKQEGLLQ
ncbi:MAG: response regulator [Magnetococcales bacterium]|nr:response regulator [Magnetococcales bacterium]